MRIKRLVLFVCFLTGAPSWLWADKIIMKDGKIYEGKIMGETSRSVLISNPPLDPKPRFVEMKDILTIVRESRPPEKPSPESGRFAVVEALLSGNLFTANTFDLSPAAGVQLGGGFRVHPALELDAVFHYLPALYGEVLVTDNVSALRGYKRFYAYEGGFEAKVFPFYRRKSWRVEPFLLGGYRWNRLVAKGSGDYFKGDAWQGGAGVSVPWFRPWYWELRAVYQRLDYDAVKFGTGQGTISGVRADGFHLFAGLSRRFL